METPQSTPPANEPFRQEAPRGPAARNQQRSGPSPLLWIIGVVTIAVLGVAGYGLLFNGGSATETVEAKAEDGRLAKLQLQLEEMQKEAAEKEAERQKELEELQKQLAEAKKPEAPAPVTPAKGSFHPAKPDDRFFVDPAPEKQEGNPDGSLFVQATPDAGILRPFPPIALKERLPHDPKSLTPELAALREKLVAAAKAQGMEAMCRGNQNAPLDSYVLCEWPSLDPSGVMYAVLRSPNVSAVRHKDTPVGGGRPPR